MNFKEKIDKLLSVSGKKFNSLYDLEVKSGVGMGTIRKAYEENREPSKRIIWKFLESLSINTDWWETGKGDIYLEKGTQMPKTDDSNGKHSGSDDERILRELIDSNDKYRLVPTIILTEYEIMSKNEIASRESILNELIASQRVVIASKNDVIAELKKEIELLKSGQIIAPPKETQKDLAVRNS